MRLLLYIALPIALVTLVWGLIWVGMQIQKGKQYIDDSRVLGKYGLTKDSPAQLTAADRIMRKLLIPDDLDNMNILNNTTRKQVEAWTETRVKEIQS